ncbi:MAG TPA: DUF2922 domain-containing protein [Tissierellia bacterium]|nr:DUF2922 domain-containing protein [Tissierellia bacterium]
MESARLEMEFLDSAGKKFRITIDNPREGITGEEIKTVMDEIVARNVFFTASGDIVSANSARLITTTVQDMEF